MIVSFFKNGEIATDVDYSYTPGREYVPPVIQEYKPAVLDEETGDILEEEVPFKVLEEEIPAVLPIWNPDCIHVENIYFDPIREKPVLTFRKGKPIVKIVEKEDGLTIEQIEENRKEEALERIREKLGMLHIRKETYKLLGEDIKEIEEHIDNCIQEYKNIKNPPIPEEITEEIAEEAPPKKPTSDNENV